MDAASRNFYVDDSGSDESGYAVYSWVEVPAGVLDDVRREWVKGFRQRLAEDPVLRIPVDYELHAVKFVKGRGRPSLNEEWNRAKANRGPVFQSALDRIAELPGVQVGAVYHLAPTRRARAAAQDELFGWLLRRLDRRLGDAGCRGRVIVDGDGNDPSFHRQFARVSPSRIDTVGFEPAHDCHLIQVADLVAYAAFQSVARQRGSAFMWHWYATHLPKADGPRLEIL